MPVTLSKKISVAAILIRATVLLAATNLVGCQTRKEAESEPPTGKSGTTASAPQLKKTTSAKPLPPGDSPAASPDDELRKVAQTYLEASYDERHRYVHNGAALKNRMAQYYADMPAAHPRFDAFKLDRIDSPRKDAAILTTTIEVGEYATRGKIYARLIGGHWLIDWPATVGLNPISIKAFISNAPREPTTLRLTAQLEDYYNYQYSEARPTHYSIQLTSIQQNDLHGYVSRRSEVGKELYELLKDGKGHRVGVTVRCTSPEGSVVEIIRLVGNDWFID